MEKESSHHIYRSALAHRPHGSPKGRRALRTTGPPTLGPQHSGRRNPPSQVTRRNGTPLRMPHVKEVSVKRNIAVANKVYIPQPQISDFNDPAIPHTNSICSPSHSLPLPHFWRQSWFRPFPCAPKSDPDSARRTSRLGRNDRPPSLPAQ